MCKIDAGFLLPSLCLWEYFSVISICYSSASWGRMCISLYERVSWARILLSLLLLLLAVVVRHVVCLSRWYV